MPCGFISSAALHCSMAFAAAKVSPTLTELVSCPLGYKLVVSSCGLPLTLHKVALSLQLCSATCCCNITWLLSACKAGGDTAVLISATAVAFEAAELAVVASALTVFVACGSALGLPCCSWLILLLFATTSASFVAASGWCNDCWLCCSCCCSCCCWWWWLLFGTYWSA